MGNDTMDIELIEDGICVLGEKVEREKKREVIKDILCSS
jgi:hypothetical protein